MNLISKFPDILEESKEKYRESLISSSTFKVTEEINWDVPMPEYPTPPEDFHYSLFFLS